MNLDRHAIESLAGLNHFPAWVWRNTEILDFIGELREYNTLLPEESKTGFYGLDRYGFYSSARALIEYLDRKNPEAAKRARHRFAALERFGRDEDSYGARAAPIASWLGGLWRERFEHLRRGGLTARGELFQARRNEQLAGEAREYYRAMLDGSIAAWNLRDRHMADTLDALSEKFSETRPAKIVVWGHNSHIGDARAADFSSRGGINMGRIVRERHGLKAALIGFTTHHGTVSAASDWGETVERRQLPPAVEGSYEDIFHRAGIHSFLLPFRGAPKEKEPLIKPRLERTIGSVYQPGSERTSHYFRASLPLQFDAVIHFDRTDAVEPLEYTPVWERGEVTGNLPARP
jgi:erythromycin esterase-like protein